MQGVSMSIAFKSSRQCMASLLHAAAVDQACLTSAGQVLRGMLVLAPCLVATQPAALIAFW
jgi:hypothetical protein